MCVFADDRAFCEVREGEEEKASIKPNNHEARSTERRKIEAEDVWDGRGESERKEICKQGEKSGELL